MMAAQAPKTLASVVAVAILALANPSWAEDVVVYQTSGHAMAGASDPRTAALDDAFARAVRSALSDLVSSEARTARQGDLDREIVGRARRWVATFTVTKDDVIDERRELMVAVQIDRDKIRERLEQLNVAVQARAEPAAVSTITVSVKVSGPNRGRPSRIVGGHGMRPAAIESTGLEALSAVFRSAGLVAVGAASSGRTDGAELPDDGGHGDAVAEGLAATADIGVGEPVLIRGQGADAVLITAHVQLLGGGTSPSAVRSPSERNARRVIAKQQANAAATLEDPGPGVARAVAQAAIALLPLLSTQLGAPERPKDASATIGDLPSQLQQNAVRPRTLGAAQPGDLWKSSTGDGASDPGVVLVRLPPGTPYTLVLAEQKFLAGAKGIRSATLRRLSPNGWFIGVTLSSDPTSSAAASRIAQIATQPPAPDVQVAVKVVRGTVEVTLSGVP